MYSNIVHYGRRRTAFSAMLKALYQCNCRRCVRQIQDDREKTPNVKKLINESFMSVYRYEQSQTEIKKITHVLTELKIPYILLKGPRVRKYYPEPWLRTSCDIDIINS